MPWLLLFPYAYPYVPDVDGCELSVYTTAGNPRASLAQLLVKVVSGALQLSNTIFNIGAMSLLTCVFYSPCSEFSVRGQSDGDRDYRHPRKKGEKAKQPISRTRRDSPAAGPSSIEDIKDGFPPLTELVEGVNKFTRNYFQLGFLPKKRFPETLLAHPTSIDVFLVVSILSISARLTPCLVRRYGSGVAAADFFIAQAQNLAQRRLYNEPTLELCQSFYLLSIAQQGSGMRNKSSVWKSYSPEACIDTNAPARSTWVLLCAWQH